MTSREHPGADAPHLRLVGRLPTAPRCPSWCEVHPDGPSAGWDQIGPAGVVKSCRRRFPPVSAGWPSGLEVEIERFATVDIGADTDADTDTLRIELTEPVISVGPCEYMSPDDGELLAQQLFEAAELLRREG